ncbi:hypothetical protein KAJ89_06150 [Candidatus Parcubacteria bacterium]|nr:hypothetical protein [Candidatus Parcubacteria bacterium]
MKQNIAVFIAIAMLALPALAGEEGFIGHSNKDKLSRQLIALCDECTCLVEELDSLLLKYAREARENMAIIHNKRETAIRDQEENKKYFVGVIIDLPIPRSEQEVHELNKKLKKAIDDWHEADRLLTRAKKDMNYSNAYYFQLVKGTVTRGLYCQNHSTLLHLLVQDKVILKARILQMSTKLCSLFKERKEIAVGKQ